MVNYMLLDASQLEGTGYDYQNNARTPDGRVVLPLSALKVLTNITPMIVSSEELRRIMLSEEATSSDEEEEKGNEQIDNEEGKEIES